MISHRPARFGSEDIFVVIERQDSTCPCFPLPLSLKHMACHAHTYEISGRRQNNLPVCPTKDSRSWSHMSTRTTDGDLLKKPFARSSKNSARINKK